MDGGLRGHDLARKPGLSNDTEYGAGDIPLPTRPPAGAGTQSTSKPPSMFRSQQTEESYPDLSSMKRELERIQRERDKANLESDPAVFDRDQAKLDRDQVKLEREKAILDRDLLMAEREQEQRLQESQKSKRLQRRQQAVASGKKKRRSATEPAVARSRPKSRMEVHEAPRASGCFNLDRVAQEHINEGLEIWTPPEPVPSLRNLETNPIRPLMEISLPVLTPSSTSGIQSGLNTSRLRELQERLQSRARENPAREERPPTWRDRPVRSVIIASYKKNTDGAYHRHNRMDWTVAQRARRDAFHDDSWAEYFTQPRISEGAVHLIIGDSLIRVLTRIQAHWLVGVFSGAATPQLLASLEMMEMAKMYKVTLMMGTNDVSRGESRKVMRLQEKMSCILDELRIIQIQQNSLFAPSRTI